MPLPSELANKHICTPFKSTFMSTLRTQETVLAVF